MKAQVAGSESADTGSKYFDLSVLKIILTDKWNLDKEDLLLWGGPRLGERVEDLDRLNCVL